MRYICVSHNNSGRSCKPGGTGAGGTFASFPSSCMEQTPSPLQAGGYTLVSSRQLSGTLYLDYTLVNILISSSPDGLIPWLRLRHAWVLASWGSIKRSLKWHGQRGEKNPKRSGDHINASDISHSSQEPEILPDVHVLRWFCVDTSICICNLLQVCPVYFVTWGFGCPQRRGHHITECTRYHTALAKSWAKVLGADSGLCS